MNRQRPEEDSTSACPEITITLGPDGRILLHDLTAGFLPVAAAICPNDRNLAQRLKIAKRSESKQ